MKNINLPKSTFLNKFIPKNIFFGKTNINSKLKTEFTNKIQKITWKYKISEETLWINKTDKIQEIEIFEIDLKEKIIPKNALKIIDKYIPYPILFIFTYKNNFSYWIIQKSIKIWPPQIITLIWDYYFSEWDEELDFDFTWINIQKVYEKIIKKFIKNFNIEEKNFEEIIKNNSEIKISEKEIKILKNKIKAEKTFNKKVDLNKILLQKNKKLELLKN